MYSYRGYTAESLVLSAVTGAVGSLFEAVDLDVAGKDGAAHAHETIVSTG